MVEPMALSGQLAMSVAAQAAGAAKRADLTFLVSAPVSPMGRFTGSLVRERVLEGGSGG